MYIRSSFFVGRSALLCSALVDYRAPIKPNRKPQERAVRAADDGGGQRPAVPGGAQQEDVVQALQRPQQGPPDPDARREEAGRQGIEDQEVRRDHRPRAGTYLPTSTGPLLVGGTDIHGGAPWQMFSRLLHE